MNCMNMTGQCVIHHVTIFATAAIYTQPIVDLPLMLCCFVSQYDGQDTTYENILGYLNTAFTVLFTIECILKLMAFGVRVCNRCCSTN